jgi:hypothetical protein
MEIIVSIQSALVVVLGYYLYKVNQDLLGVKQSLDWAASEIFALKSQIKSVYFADMGNTVSVVKKKPAVKQQITKSSRKDKQ